MLTLEHLACMPYLRLTRRSLPCETDPMYGIVHSSDLEFASHLIFIFNHDIQVMSVQDLTCMSTIST